MKFYRSIQFNDALPFTIYFLHYIDLNTSLILDLFNFMIILFYVLINDFYQMSGADGVEVNLTRRRTRSSRCPYRQSHGPRPTAVSEKRSCWDWTDPKPWADQRRQRQRRPTFKSRSPDLPWGYCYLSNFLVSFFSVCYHKILYPSLPPCLNKKSSWNGHKKPSYWFI